MGSWGVHVGPGWNFTEPVRQVLAEAQTLAKQRACRQIEAHHVASALFSARPEPVARVCHALGIDADALADRLLTSSPAAAGGGSTAFEMPQLRYAPSAKAVIKEALEAAIRANASEIGSDLLVLAVVRASAGATHALLAEAGLTEDAVLSALGRASR